MQNVDKLPNVHLLADSLVMRTVCPLEDGSHKICLHSNKGRVSVPHNTNISGFVTDVAVFATEVAKLELRCTL